MATNNFKPFAVGEGANVLTDSELASRSELQTGFPFKSKADSKLMGKLIQDASAGAYALGSFTVKYADVDVTGSDAEGLATNFESALTAFVGEKAPTPDLSAYLTTANASATYATKIELNAKADSSALASYAPLANPAFTGTATLNGQNVATVNQIPDTSHFVTDTTLASYPTSETVEAEFSSYDKNIKAHIESELTGYAPLANPAFTGTATLGGQNIATVNQIPDVSTKINILGSRGSLAGYEGITVESSAITINQDSPDSQQITAAVAITVSNGSANQSWVKKVSIKDAGTTISLGTNWKWSGGSQPTVTAPSLLVCSWDNDCGIAILQTTA